MRTSIMSRSVIAVASIAIGSAALTASPASAAASEVTRAEVLGVAAAVRADSPTSAPGGYSAGTMQAIKALAGRACLIEQHPGQVVYGVQAAATEAGQGADGLVVRANIRNGEGSVYACSFAAVATVAGSSILSGSVQLGPAPVSTALSGEVTVTPPVYGDYSSSAFPTLQAAGQSVQTVKVVTSKKVSTPKSAKQKKYAKNKYTKRIKAAKKAYAKALKKAGHSKTKKRSAKKSYSKKRAVARASYKKSIATSKIVRKTTVTTSSSPFNLTATTKP